MVVSMDAPDNPNVPCRESEDDVCIMIGVAAFVVVVVSRCPDEFDDDNSKESLPPNSTVRIDCTNVSGLYTYAPIPNSVAHCAPLFDNNKFNGPLPPPRAAARCAMLCVSFLSLFLFYMC